MSAYALPGLLFPPLPSCFDTYGDRNNNSSSANIPNYHHHPTIHNHDRINVNLYLTKTNSTHMNEKGDSSLPIPSLCKETSCHLPQNLSVSKVSSMSNDSMKLHHQISIIDAKIDAIRLIKSFMSTPSSSSSSNTHLRRRPFSSSQHQGSTNDFYEEYMIFTFQIVQSNIEEESDDDPASMTLNNNHNTITKTRTLQQIIQFYDDVCQYDSDIPNLRKLLHYDTLNCVNTLISPQPTLPTVPHQHRSFAYLQDHIRTFTPVIEQWIRTIGRFVFESQSHNNNNSNEITTTNSLCQIWNDFVTHPVHVPSQDDDHDDNNEGYRRLHSSPSSMTTTAEEMINHHDSMFVSTISLLPLRRHPTSSSSHCSSRRRSHSKKQTMKPRRIVSMESIDEEEME